MSNPNTYIETMDEDEKAAMDKADDRYMEDRGRQLADELMELRTDTAAMKHLVLHHPYLVKEMRRLYDERAHALRTYRQKVADRSPARQERDRAERAYDIRMADAERWDGGMI